MRIPLYRERPSLRAVRSPIRRVLVILAPTEADVKPVRILWRKLRRLGVEVVTATECHGEVRGQHDEALFPNLLLVDAASRDWDAVIVAGGSGAQWVADDPFARELVTRALGRGKPVGALGLGRAVLARADASGFSSDDPSAMITWLCERLNVRAPPAN